MSKIFKKSDVDFCNLPLALTDENVKKAYTFALKMRKDTYGEPTCKNKYYSENSININVMSLHPRNVCRFTLLFTSIVFEGTITGNCNHQFIAHDAGIIDLNANDENLKYLPNTYKVDKNFIGSRGHLSSMKSCAPVVLTWLINMFPALKDEDFETA